MIGSRYALSVACNASDSRLLRDLDIEGALHRVDIQRSIRPLKDLVALARLALLFRRERFDLIHSVTPKAGLLAMLGAMLAGCRLRVHTFTGQVWLTRSGMMRRVLRTADKLIASLATHVLADGISQRNLLVAEGVVPAAKISVLARGSIAGVDTSRFVASATVRHEVRTQLGIPETGFVFLFVGRLRRDKGVLDLALAFREIAQASTRAWLVLVGPDEDGILTRVRELSGSGSSRLHAVDYTPAPERFMAAADVLCLPSYREGFNNAVIEAAACAVPAVASRISGIVDSVTDGVTGLLHRPGDIEALSAQMRSLLEDGALRERLGRAAHEHVIANFSANQVTRALLDYYHRLLQNGTAQAVR